MTPDDLLTAAKYLAETREKMAAAGRNLPGWLLEHLARTSVASAYYACYHLALEYAKENGYSHQEQMAKMRVIKDKNPAANMPMGTHSALWHWFEMKSHREIAARGRGLHSKRVDACYSISAPFKHAPEDINEESEELIQLIDDLRVPSRALVEPE